MKPPTLHGNGGRAPELHTPQEKDISVVNAPTTPFTRRLGLTAAATFAVAGAVTALGAPEAQAADKYNMGSATLYRSVKWQKKGNKYVTALQKALNDVHKAGLAVDGSFGAATERAVKSFQKSKKLAVDGRVGPATKRSLNAAAGSAGSGGGGATAPAPSTGSGTHYDMGSATLYRGVKWQKKGNKYVTALQKALNDVHKAGLGVDGSFGAATERAVKSFQKSKKLGVDGRVGPATKSALNAGSSGGGSDDSGSTAGLLAPVTAITPVKGGVPLKSGWNGTRVRIIQKKLGVHRTGPRQTFDSETRSAVINFQKRNGLAADGVVGAKTWAKLAPEYPFTMDSWQASVQCSKSASSSQRIDQMIRFAKAQLGTPYTWGGAGWKNASVAGFDCSGLVLQAMYSAGLDPQPINVVKHAEPTYRTSAQLYAHKGLKSVPRSQMRKGDLVFFSRTSGGPVTHVALYLGGGQVIESWSTDCHIIGYSGGSTFHGSYYYAKPNVKRPFV